MQQIVTAPPTAGEGRRVQGMISALVSAGRRGDRDEPMANTAAYSGLRWGELAALTIAQVDPATRVIAVDRKVAGHLYLEAPKNRKRRRTSYPRTTPAGYPAGRPARAGPRRAGRRRHHRHPVIVRSDQGMKFSELPGGASPWQAGAA